MDWDTIAAKLKEGFDEDTVEDLIETLKKAVNPPGGANPAGGAGATPDDIAAALGRILGKFGGGVAGGATGLDPDLLKLLLELLGPLARDLLARLIERFVGGGERYRTEHQGGHKYSKIVRHPKDVFDLVEDLAPDVFVTDNLRPECKGDSVQFTLSLKVVCQEEPIRFIQVQSMGPAGSQAYPRITMAGDPGSKLPKRDDQEVDASYDVQFTIDVPCTEIFKNGGTVIFVITVQDFDGNQVVDFCEAEAADFVLKNKCCGTNVDEVFRARLLDLIRTGMRPLTPGDLEKLIELIVRPKTEARPAPSTPAPPPETAPKTPAPKIPPKKTGAGVKLGELLVEIPIEDLEAFEDDLEVQPPPERRGGPSTKRPR
ncbi:hypothetical protein ASD38_08995 [Caulobacter sp. Root487D2Y]|uniref:hypothetical protein n=1 Tax=Caulobacter sp. Root487D2Y TaxID=1736547 RepID=UPI0006FCC13D|nr:hypothetical protein [Caulobacter sp. Root487D2Y]KQY29474.1 hypothetical protein ASD38_08995 [Caulobacter sp. Root487D2Y]